ncbi:hypothetical protein ACQQ2N_05500 [Dokdonella sp. MW10]|uniref:hypothetical protein n=1 Tax=Dokdonella sp. MW10 TaxID=2992926 RepID=UPI003F80914B
MRRPRTACSLLVASILLAASPWALAVDDDDDDAGEAALVLEASQREAIGLRVARPVAVTAPNVLATSARVLDATDILAAAGEAEAASAGERVASEELARVRALHADGAAASRRVVDAAVVEQARQKAARDVAERRLAQLAGFHASTAARDRDATLEALRSGTLVLLRAEVTGRESLAGVPRAARVSIDGVAHDTRVLGPLQGAGEIAAPALLLALDAPPEGLVPGMRLAATLGGEPVKGVAVPRGALLHDERGAHVYLQSAGDGGTMRYTRRDVSLRVPFGEGWLVDGLDDDDDVVVAGVGLLWSMQGGHVDDDD